MKKFSYVIPFVFFALFVFDLLHAQNAHDIYIFLGLFFGFLLIKLYKVKSKGIFIFSLGLLLLFCYNLLIHSDASLTERISIWLYFSLILGVITQFFELRKK